MKKQILTLLLICSISVVFSQEFLTIKTGTYLACKSKYDIVKLDQLLINENYKELLETMTNLAASERCTIIGKGEVFVLDPAYTNLRIKYARKPMYNQYVWIRNFDMMIK